MHKLGKTGLVGVLVIIAVFIIVGVMILDQNKEQTETTSKETRSILERIGKSFIWAAVIGFLLLVLMIIIKFAKKIGAL